MQQLECWHANDANALGLLALGFRRCRCFTPTRLLTSARPDTPQSSSPQDLSRCKRIACRSPAKAAAGDLHADDDDDDDDDDEAARDDVDKYDDGDDGDDRV